jgi:hypothetical protein
LRLDAESKRHEEQDKEPGNRDTSWFLHRVWLF